MSVSMPLAPNETHAVEIRVRGCVQGVGFRPTVWRIARELSLGGEVLNDAEGVLIRVRGEDSAIRMLLARLRKDAPPLSRIDRITTRPYRGAVPASFRI